MNYKYGDKGEVVKQIQRTLHLVDDGIFGHLTEEAVIAFQRENGLVADGIVGPATLTKLLAAKFSIKKSRRKIYGIVIDGMWGLMQALRRYPVQMCQFHQQMIVRRYLAEDPDLDAARDLLDLVNAITVMDKESFIGAFNEWYERYKDVLNERVHDRRIKRITPPYMRPRLRSAYLSLRRHMSWLWTFYDYNDRVIPNTNNGLEGIFSDIKSKVRVHSGINKEHRKKLNDEYISRHY